MLMVYPYLINPLLECMSIIKLLMIKYPYFINWRFNCIILIYVLYILGLRVRVRVRIYMHILIYIFHFWKKSCNLFLAGWVNFIKRKSLPCRVLLKAYHFAWKFWYLSWQWVIEITNVLKTQGNRQIFVT